jgi:hypothetical protein
VLDFLLVWWYIINITKEDKMTNLQKALEELKNGNEELAWENAKKDEGLQDSTKKADWIIWAYELLEEKKQEEGYKMLEAYFS